VQPISRKVIGGKNGSIIDTYPETNRTDVEYKKINKKSLELAGVII
jgi:hypothetical protein